MTLIAAVERLAMIDLPPFDAKAPHEGLVIMRI